MSPKDESSSFLAGKLPDEILSLVLSFCDFQSSLALRATDRRNKTLIEEEMEQLALRKLPIECSEEDYDNDPHNNHLTLQFGWSESYLSRDALIEDALSYADPGGQVSLDADYNEDRARQPDSYFGVERGWVDVEDFLDLGEDNDSDEDDNGRGDMDEVGWGVRIVFGRVFPPKEVWRAVNSMLSEFKENTDGQADVSVLQQSVFSLLLRACRSSITLASLSYEYRHTDYPSGGKRCTLMFLTSDNQRVELVGSSTFEVL
jgi:hypothetical protein